MEFIYDRRFVNTTVFNSDNFKTIDEGFDQFTPIALESIRDEYIFVSMKSVNISINDKDSYTQRIQAYFLLLKKDIR